MTSKLKMSALQNTVKKMRSSSQTRGNIFAIHVSNKKLVTSIHKELLRFNNKTNNQIVKDGERFKKTSLKNQKCTGKNQDV